MWIGRAGQHTAAGAKPLAYMALDWVSEKILFSFPNPCDRVGGKVTVAGYEMFVMWHQQLCGGMFLSGDWWSWRWKKARQYQDFSFCLNFKGSETLCVLFWISSWKHFYPVWAEEWMPTPFDCHRLSSCCRKIKLRNDTSLSWMGIFIIQWGSPLRELSGSICFI